MAKQTKSAPKVETKVETKAEIDARPHAKLGEHVFTCARDMGEKRVEIIKLLLKAQDPQTVRNSFVYGDMFARLRAKGFKECQKHVTYAAACELLERLLQDRNHAKRDVIVQAYSSARTAWARLVADVDYERDRRGGSANAQARNTRTPMLQSASKTSSAPNASAPNASAPSAPVAPIVPPPVLKPVTFEDVRDSVLALTRSLQAIGKKHAAMQGFAGIASAISQGALIIEKACLATKG